MRNLKANIEFHSEHYSKSNPAINVKVYHYPRINDVVEKFKCSEETAEKALGYAFESAQMRFWEDMKEIVKIIFPHASMYSEGRSGGWLVVHGLPDVETWDAIATNKWFKLEKQVKEEIKFLTSKEYVLEDIEGNQWFKDGSELYNFVDTKDGQTKVIADLKQDAIKAGFGPVINK